MRVLPDQPGVVRGAEDAGTSTTSTMKTHTVINIATCLLFSAIELVQELSEYLAVRYASTFHVERDIEPKTDEKRFVERGWAGAPPIKSITNLALGVTYELNKNAEDMMKVAALLSACIWSSVVVAILTLMP